MLLLLFSFHYVVFCCCCLFFCIFSQFFSSSPYKDHDLHQQHQKVIIGQKQQHLQQLQQSEQYKFKEALTTAVAGNGFGGQQQGSRKDDIRPTTVNTMHLLVQHYRTNLNFIFCFCFSALSFFLGFCSNLVWFAHHKLLGPEHIFFVFHSQLYVCALVWLSAPANGEISFCFCFSFFLLISSIVVAIAWWCCCYKYLL